MRIVAHATFSCGRKLPQVRHELAFRREQLVWSVAFHPRLERSQMLGILRELRERHLVRTPAVFDHDAIDLARSSPAFRRLQNQSRPARALTQTVRARIVLNRANA